MAQRKIEQALRDLKSDRPPTVEKAAQLLMKLAPGLSRFEETLRERLNDPSVRVRSLVVRALGDLPAAKRHQAQGVGTIKAKATNLGGHSVEVNIYSEYTVWNLKEPLAHVLGTTAANLTLITAQELGNKPCGTPLEDSWVLGEIGFQADFEVTVIVLSEAASQSANADIDLLIQQLDDANDDCKIKAIQALAKSAVNDHERIVEPLLRCLMLAQEPGHWTVPAQSKRVELEAAQLLCHLAPQAVTNILLRRLRHEEDRIRAIQRIEATESKEGRKRGIGKRVDIDAEWKWLLQLAGLLVPVARHDPRTTEILPSLLIECLSRSSPWIRKEAMNIIGELDADDPRIVEALIQLMSHEKREDVLISAVKALKQQPSEDPRIVESITRCIDEFSQKSHANLRNVAAEALREIEVSFCSRGLDMPAALVAQIAKRSADQSVLPEDEIPESWDS